MPLSSLDGSGGAARRGGRLSLKEPIFHGYAGFFLFISIIRQEPHWRIPDEDAEEFAEHLDHALKGIRKSSAWLKYAEKYAPWLTVAGVAGGHIVARVLQSNQLAHVVIPETRNGSGPAATHNGNGVPPDARGYSGAGTPSSNGDFTPDPEAVRRAAMFRADLDSPF